MNTPRISASSYSNTAPLVWSFLYGLNHGKVELILDNAPARSAELLAQGRVDAALVPVIAFQAISDLRIVPGVCVGTRDGVRSVCIATSGRELRECRSIALDTSSQTSVVLAKIIFREFLGIEPEYRDSSPEVDAMLEVCDAALIIGDPALEVASRPDLKVFDLAAVWHGYTGFGFMFAMWMTKRDRLEIDFASARDEGIAHIDCIAANYASQTGLGLDEMQNYLTHNIAYSPDETMERGMELFFELAAKNGLIPANRPLDFL